MYNAKSRQKAVDAWAIIHKASLCKDLEIALDLYTSGRIDAGNGHLERLKMMIKDDTYTGVYDID